MKKLYTIVGLIDVSMYNSILSPEVVFDDDDNSPAWDEFSFAKYSKKVLERAKVELEKLLATLPTTHEFTLVSTKIVSPKFYNYTTDTLHSVIEAKSEMSEDEMQAYLTDAFLHDWEAEFGAAYRIYEYMSGNCSLYEFCENNEDKEQQLKTEVYSFITRCVGDYNSKIAEAILDEVVRDVIECSAYQDEGYWTDDDIVLAFGRVLCHQLKIECD